MTRIEIASPIRIHSPDDRLALYASIGEDGRSYSLRLELAGRTMIECRVASRGKATGSVDVNELISGVDVLAMEIDLRFARGGCVARVADGSLAVSAHGDASISPTLPRTATFCLAPVYDGCGYARLGPAACRHRLPNLNGLVMYCGGECAMVYGDSRTLVVSASSSPSAAILPRGMHHALQGLGDASGGASASDAVSVRRPSRDAAFNVTAFFLRAGYISEALAKAGVSIEACDALPTVVASPSPSVSATKAHIKAYRMLAEPSAGDSATAFRGEVGEYACGARRLGRTWYVAGFTSRPRVLTLMFPFLDDGVEYEASWTLDDGASLPTNAANPTPSRVKAGDKATVMMCAGGGFVVRLRKARR